jgi:ATP-binding cassette subfamily C protein
MEHIAAAERVRETGAPPPSPAASRPLRHELLLESVCYSYGERLVLSDATATLEAGRLVVVTGPSGSGKTTLTDLVTGLLRPTAGRVLVDGVDATTMDMAAWRRSIGYVPQEPMLFSDTIRANVTLDDEAVDDGQVERALRAAGAWDFVSRLPQRLEHRIGDSGSGLSGGEKQRLAIARALVGSPSLLVLDEPTSGLDRAMEAQICSTIASLRGGLTIWIVSHQAAVHAIADEIWDLREGRIVVSGPPVVRT